MGARGLVGAAKKAVAEGAHLVLIDETGLFLNPLVRRTRAPKGRTPVFDGWGRHRQKVSVIGAVSVSPTARRLGFYWASDPKEYFDPRKVVGFLRNLLRHLRGKVIVAWDGGTNHKGAIVRGFLARNARLRLERLPAYAPDLNPVEAVWSWLKYGQLSNYVPGAIHELDTRVTDRLTALRADRRLLRQLWKGSDLPFPGETSIQPQQPADQ